MQALRSPWGGLRRACVYKTGDAMLDGALSLASLVLDCWGLLPRGVVTGIEQAGGTSGPVCGWEVGRFARGSGVSGRQSVGCGIWKW